MSSDQKYNPTQAAKIWGKGKGTIRDLMLSGQLPYESYTTAKGVEKKLIREESLRELFGAPKIETAHTNPEPIRPRDLTSSGPTSGESGPGRSQIDPENNLSEFRPNEPVQTGAKGPDAAMLRKMVQLEAVAPLEKELEEMKRLLAQEKSEKAALEAKKIELEEKAKLSQQSLQEKQALEIELATVKAESEAKDKAIEYRDRSIETFKGEMQDFKEMFNSVVQMQNSKLIAMQKALEFQKEEAKAKEEAIAVNSEKRGFWSRLIGR